MKLCIMIFILISGLAYGDCSLEKAEELAFLKSARSFGGAKFHRDDAKAKCAMFGKVYEGRFEENIECLVTLEARGSLIGHYYKFDKETCAIKDSLGLKLHNVAKDI